MSNWGKPLSYDDAKVWENIIKKDQEIKQMKQENEKLRAKLTKAHEVLEFYATNWRSDIYVGPTEQLIKDFGAKARELLEEE